MRKTGSFRKLLNLGRLARDEEGTVLIYVSVALTVFMGFAALVIDGSRLFTLDTEMQSASDAIALAGAAELDGSNDSITRATRAMDNLVRNYETFGNNSSSPITGYKARFLTALPASDADPITDALVLDPDDADSGPVARFVEVRLLQEPAAGGKPATDNSRSVSVLFASAIGGGSTVRAGATSVAGYTQAVCKFTPLFMCNPYSSPSEFLEKVGQPAERRRIIALKQSNGGAGSPKYGPGNFGFLSSIADDTSFKESLAKVNPGACFEQQGVDTEPGNKVSSRTALNTRFDLYDGMFKNASKYRNNVDYRPAQNVTKGYTGKNCNQTQSSPPTAMGLPVDSVIDATSRMGNGVWNVTSYWSVNHPTISYPPAGKTWGTTDANRPSRYDVYRWEIDTGHIPDNKTGESGIPQCSKAATTPDPDRRILYAAIIDCAEYGDMVKGKATGIPVLAFVKMFMTQPMTKKATCGSSDEESESVDCNDTLYVEMIDKVDPGNASAVVHDMVQLYR